MLATKYGKPTNLVDVYAFAMVALELVSLKLPFDGLEDIQIALGILRGKRPDIPSDCDPFLKDLMVECWQGEPNKRSQFLQILEKLKSQKGEFMWPVEFPNLLELSKQFPIVGKIPKAAFDIIVDRMNLDDRLNDWQAFVSQLWPKYTTDDIKIKFKDKMQSVLHVLDGEGEKTSKLLDLLEKVKRKDVLLELEEYSRYRF